MKQNQFPGPKPKTDYRSLAGGGFKPERDQFRAVTGRGGARAYFSYENQGSLPGHDVQHWLKAEAELITERNLTRVMVSTTKREATIK